MDILSSFQVTSNITSLATSYAACQQQFIGNVPQHDFNITCKQGTYIDALVSYGLYPEVSKKDAELIEKIN